MSYSPIVTLLTDFGQTDHRAAALAAAVLRHSPPTTRLLTLSHQIAPFHLAHAAHVLGAAFPEFPAGTIHVAVVAGHEGAAGEYLAARYRDQFFLLPDNGLLTLLLDGHPAEVVRLPHHPGPARHALAPAAGHLAREGSLLDLGAPATSVVELTHPQVRVTDNRLTGHVVHVDHFGNLVTNLTRSLIAAVGAERPFQIRFARESVSALQPHYGAAEPGDVACVYDSRGRLCIGLNRGHAAELLGMGYESTVLVEFGE